MLETAAFSTALALAPPTELAPPDFGSQLDTVEFIDGGDDVQLVAYDVGGEVIGMIALWVDERERIHLSSDYGDGYVEAILDHDRVTVDSTLPAAVAEERVRLILAGLNPQEGKGWLGCALSVGASAASCSLALPSCPFAMGAAACHCLPLAVKEFEGHSCYHKPKSK
jgi:hypothetical protein